MRKGEEKNGSKGEGQKTERPGYKQEHSMCIQEAIVGGQTLSSIPCIGNVSRSPSDHT